MLAVSSMMGRLGADSGRALSCNALGEKSWIVGGSTRNQGKTLLSLSNSRKFFNGLEELNSVLLLAFLCKDGEFFASIRVGACKVLKN